MSECQTCKTCRWWRHLPIQDGHEGNTGECRRYPPRIFDRQSVSETWFPESYHEDWCGEHAPKGGDEG